MHQYYPPYRVFPDYQEYLSCPEVRLIPDCQYFLLLLALLELPMVLVLLTVLELQKGQMVRRIPEHH